MLTVASVVPAVVVASPSIDATQTDDPIFAVVEAYRNARAQLELAIDDAGKIERAAGAAARMVAHVRMGTITSDEDGTRKPWYVFSHEEINTEMDRREKLFGVYMTAEQRKRTAARRVEYHASLDRDLAELEAGWERTGVKAARDREDLAFEREGELIRAACYVVPKTLPGLALFVDLMRKHVWQSEAGELGREDGKLATEQSYVTLQTAVEYLAADYLLSRIR